MTDAPASASVKCIRARYIVIAIAPIPLALIIGVAGLVAGSRTIVYVSIAISLIAMPVGGVALARLFGQIMSEPAEPTSRRTISRQRSPGSH